VTPSRPQFLFPVKNDHFRQQYFADGVGQDPICLAALGTTFDQSWPFNPVRWSPWTGCRKVLGMSGPGGLDRKLTAGRQNDANDPRRTLGESDGLDDRRHKPRVGVSC